jgi:hypothetical protein
MQVLEEMLRQAQHDKKSLRSLWSYLLCVLCGKNIPTPSPLHRRGLFLTLSFQFKAPIAPQKDPCQREAL